MCFLSDAGVYMYVYMYVCMYVCVLFGLLIDASSLFGQCSFLSS